MVGYDIINSTMTSGKDEYEVDYDTNITRLYEAITNCDWDVAIDAVHAIPKEARTWVVRRYEDGDDIMWRFLPIHSACARQPPAALISALLKAYPEGARCVDDQGMYPLHYACGNQASREVVRLLLVANPQATKIPDPRGMLPIHYLACWGPSNVSVIDMVLVANRDVGDATDADGNTALDLAKDGEYPEKEAVIAALKRWFDQSKVSSVGDKDVSLQYSSSPSSDMKGTDPSPSIATTSALVTRLRNEISKLRAEQRQREEEVERKVEATAAIAHRAQMSEFEKQLQKANKDLADAKQQLERKDRILADKDARIESLTKKLFALELEHDDLRQTLLDVNAESEASRRKSEHMNDRVGSLSVSLSSMMDQQAELMRQVKDKEDRLLEEASIRRSKLQSMIDQEERIISSATIGGVSSTTLAFERQAKEMDAIAAVIAAIRK